jgi:branched-chain amino acid transport system substrate-binding protein
MKASKLMLMVALVVALALTLSACGGAAAPTTAPSGGGTQATTAPSGGGFTGNTIKLVSSYPLTGGDSDAGVGIVNASKQAFAKHGAKSGNYTLVYESWDDASAARGSWDPDVETSNANKAAADPSILVYLGTYNSGAVELSIPILDQAGPLVIISAANTYPGLTKKIGAQPDEPDKYYPTGVRNYTRVCPADDIQGKVGANWVKSAGFKSVYILDDQQLYGKGIADVFEAQAKANGTQVLGHDGVDTKATDYSAQATKIANLNPDVVYYAAVASSHPGLIVKALHSAGWKGQFMGPDGIAQQSYVKEAGADAEGTFVTFAGLPPEEIAKASAEGKAWYDDYVKTYNLKPDPYSTYGYEAMSVALAAIDSCVQKGDVSRKCVRDAVFATKDFKGILGRTWSFDANGDTTLTTMSKNVVKNGDFQFMGIAE